MFRSIKSPLGIIVSSAVFFATAMVLWLAISEHEDLYHKAVRGNVNALATNLTDDLAVVLEGENINYTELSVVLAQLEAYDNIISAGVYDDDGALLSQVDGKAVDRATSPVTEKALDAQTPAGVFTENKTTIKRSK